MSSLERTFSPETSYAGEPGKLALKGSFLGRVRNIRLGARKSKDALE